MVKLLEDLEFPADLPGGKNPPSFDEADISDKPGLLAVSRFDPDSGVLSEVPISE